jgi:competence protein ComEA
MNRMNIIVILVIIIVIIAFLLGFSVAKSKGDTNQNINNINIGTTTKDKTAANVNTADKDELMSIKGIGEKKADLIIKHRPYKSIWDLASLDGISEDFIKDIREEITVNATSS